ncbi:hypothetical protein O5D80_000811 [Batrachochytrium dendrobatidis]|nr:hypothetical protein O5D80_000811 [Batrachochytrium dendrobatidis]
MVKVFISNVDTPLGHNLSRLLANTVIGSRREDENEEEEEDAQTTAVAAGKNPASENLDASLEGFDKTKPDDKLVKETYLIVGTMQRKPDLSEVLNNPQLALSALSCPGKMIESGDKKKDAARREAIEKMSMLGQKPKWVKDIVNNTARDQLLQTLLASDVIIYDMTSNLDETAWAIEALSEKADTFDKPKTFIAVSSIMTWARTKVESDDGDGSIAEDEFRRRKAHPNWKNHLALEKNIIKYGKKTNLKTYVVAAGLIYHAGDSIFHSLFKAAWHNEPELHCYGDGSNHIPTVHLDDLISIIVELIETAPENKYLVAVDESKNTLYEIIKAISEFLGTGAVKKLAKEDAFLDKSLSQADYDMLTVDLKLDPSHTKEMSVEWKYESGFVEAISMIVQEFKDARGMWPLKAVIHGPPASGKTTLTQKIANHYKIHSVEVDQVVQEAMNRLERRVAGELNEEDQEDDIDAEKELLNEIKEATKNNNGKCPTSHVINFVKEYLRSMKCRNQGYILDGFPTTTEEAKILFEASDEDSKDDKTLLTDDPVFPEFVFSLEASDAFLKQRIMKLPEASISGTRNSEEALTKRLEEYRKVNTDETTVLNYFDEQEVHPTIIDVEKMELTETIEMITKVMGGARNYGPSVEEISAERFQMEAAKAKSEALAAEERSAREKEESERHAKAKLEWNMRLEEVRKQEKEVLEAQSLPLRNYLMKYIMPTLTAGLIEIAKIRPDDPVDSLAEFLFKHNPGNTV